MIDTLLDRTVVLGWSRVGFALRRRGWTDPPPDALRGKRALVTGASGGLGLATVEGLARLGATVHLTGRSAERGEEAAARVRAAVPGADLLVSAVDVGDLDDVRRFAAGLPPLDVLVHNAGVLPKERVETAQGHEQTLAVHVLGPYLLTVLTRPGRALFVSSGGMYAQRLPVDDLQFRSGRYGGTAAYARTKRMQVVLAGLLARELAPDTLVHALHPGWAASPGLTDSLPGFDRLVTPILRTPAQGADTAVWLAAAPDVGTGRFWQDRAPRPIHYLPWTREDPKDQERFLAEVRRLTGEPAAP